MCGSSGNKFYEISQVSNRFDVVGSILVAGRSRRVTSIMIYKMSWLRTSYFGPMNRLADRFNPEQRLLHTLQESDCLTVVQYFNKRLRIQQNILPLNHSSQASTYSDLGQIYYSMKKYDEELSYFTKTFELQLSSYPENHPLLAKSYYVILTTFTELHQYQETITHISKAIHIINCSIEPDHSQAKHYQKYRNELLGVANGENMNKKTSLAKQEPENSTQCDEIVSKALTQLECLRHGLKQIMTTGLEEESTELR
ncbi:unnamed protein product [Rotaria magnacalcarata]|uniref:Uncharacterized protein n=1 Tax=Rotaria magnacalcarata TaxID=392030 RepID=A0A820CT68_9BILA|nr:unnamed protein product [Rotaria magnacalcarata]CAF4226082.1 unnamed protein product [Rotaria magnacalcarata]